MTSPPLYLEARNVIAININLKTKARPFYATHLFAKSKKATFIRLFLSQKNNSFESDLKFLVYQDVGFDDTEKRSYKISQWSAELFKTLESLLVERWNTLGGEVLHVSTNYEDKPFIFVSSKGEVTGISVKLLDVIAARMNFRYTTQFGAKDGKY